MSTVKISDLPEITHLNSDTTQVIVPLVDVSSDTTAKVTVRTLAEGLFHNDALKVGENEILFPNTIAQFSSSGNPFLQVNLQNTDKDSSGDYVITADVGTNANNFIDMGINGSNYAVPEYNAMKPLDGYLFVIGSLTNSADGNLVIGTASSEANVVVAAGGTTTENVVAHFTKNGLVFQNSAQLEFTDGSIQSVAAAPSNLTQSAYDVANTASANTIIIQGVDVEQNTQITNINQYAQSGFATANDANDMAVGAYNKANNALANTSGTFAGDLTITGNTSITGFVDIVKSNFDANIPLVQIIASDDGSYVAPSNSYYMMHITGKANNSTRFVLDSFGANTYPLISGRTGRGSAAAPASTANNDVLMRIVGNGYTGTQFPSSSPTKIDFLATENFSDTNRGTAIQFWNTPNGSNTIQKIASFNANEVQFTGVLNPQKGFIFTPRILPGIQTAITIDYATDSTIKAVVDGADLTISHSNYVAGKIVEVWLTNTGAQNRTVTHGCTALNSTNKSTTFTLTSASSAYMRYFSINGDNANTFVTISA